MRAGALSASGVAAASPLQTYRAYLAEGQLAYQFDTVTGQPVFYPRVLGPASGNPSLEWRESRGLGTVYAVTVIAPKGEPPYNVVLVDMDEGFRLMSRVETPSAKLTPTVVIGARVSMRVCRDGEHPYPVFDILQAGGEGATP